MCGIAGILNFDKQAAIKADRLVDMGNRLEHRGPDEKGYIIDANVGLAHRRLSIIDLVHGRQPMPNVEKDVWLTYNGEIYNYRRLRARLEEQGCRFTTDSDTEVVLQAYMTYGEDCVQHLQGMFAFAVWDKRRQKLFMARDRVGIKPLYYALTGSELLFASEIKAILAAGPIKPVFNRKVLPEYLANRYVAGEETFFEDIYKLSPGTVLSWTPGEGVRKRRYWRLPAAQQTDPGSFSHCAGEVRARLEEAIDSHLMSDVPLGLFLSGGIDSTALAIIAASRRNEPVQTFSVGFDEAEANELEYARMAADAAGSVHRDITVTPEAFFQELPRLIWHEDEPIAFPSSIPLYFVSKLAQEHVKVVLTGEGADELFLGYNRYRVTAWNQRLGRHWAMLPGPLRAGVAGLVGRMPGPAKRYASRSFLAWSAEIQEIFYENFSVFPSPMRGGALQDAEGETAPYAEALRHYQDGPEGELGRMGYADMHTYLVELLMKQDQMSMAASIESRVPFLDHKFIEYVSSLPDDYKVRGWRTKAVLREALEEVVPKPILHRKKMGFPVPLNTWFRDRFHSLVDEFVTGSRALARGHFNPAFIKGLVEQHRRGSARHGDRLWLLINLEIWQRIFIDGEAPEMIYAGMGTAKVKPRARTPRLQTA